MAKKFIAKSHLVDVDGNIVAPDTEIEAAKLGDAKTIKRYQELDAIEDAKSGVIVTGDETAEAKKKAEGEAADKAKKEAAEAKK